MKTKHNQGLNELPPKVWVNSHGASNQAYGVIKERVHGLDTVHILMNPAFAGTLNTILSE